MSESMTFVVMMSMDTKHRALQLGQHTSLPQQFQDTAYIAPSETGKMVAMQGDPNASTMEAKNVADGAKTQSLLSHKQQCGK